MRFMTTKCLQFYSTTLPALVFTLLLLPSASYAVTCPESAKTSGAVIQEEKRQYEACLKNIGEGCGKLSAESKDARAGLNLVKDLALLQDGRLSDACGYIKDGVTQYGVKLFLMHRAHMNEGTAEGTADFLMKIYGSGKAIGEVLSKPSK